VNFLEGDAPFLPSQSLEVGIFNPAMFGVCCKLSQRGLRQSPGCKRILEHLCTPETASGTYCIIFFKILYVQRKGYKLFLFLCKLVLGKTLLYCCNPCSDIT